MKNAGVLLLRSLWLSAYDSGSAAHGEKGSSRPVPATPPRVSSDNLLHLQIMHRVAARRDGLNQVNPTVLSDDATRTFAVQGELHSPHMQITHAPTAEAIHTPIDKSSMAWDQNIQKKQQEKVQSSLLQDPNIQASSRANTTPGM